VNGASGNIAAAVAAFSQYDLLIVGDGLESPTHPDYANTVAILSNSGMANTAVFGYIDSTQTTDVVQGKIDQWSALNIKGIFLDKFGYDYGNTRQHQREIVWSTHNKNGGLKAFVNAWNPDDAFSPAVDSVHNPGGLATELGANDYYLAESFAVNEGAYDDSNTNGTGVLDFQYKAQKMSGYNATYGTQMAAIATLGTATFVQNFADYSYFASVLNGFNAWGFGEEYYSASSCNLPFRIRATFYGTAFTGAITTVGGLYEHQTNVGIHVDTNAHTVNILL